MKITPAIGFSLRALSPPGAEEEPRCELLMDDASTGKLLDGAILETALAWGEHLLLFLTDDIPFEECLRIYLLDRDFNTLDSAHLVAMYATGVFSDLDLTQHDAVRFRFFGGTVYTLTLLPKESFAIPFFSDPSGVWRPFKWTRRFRIDDHPAPEKAD